MGNFLSDNGIILANGDMKVVCSFSDRKQALEKERNLVHHLNNSNITILNNVYSLSCTRVGLVGRDNPMAKQYMFIDLLEKTATPVYGLKQECSSLGLPYKEIAATVKGNPMSYNNRFLVRYLEDWHKLTSKEKKNLIDGTWIIERRLLGKKSKTEKTAKRYSVQTPDGKLIEVINLDKFAEEMGINSGNLHASFSTGRKASGYKVIQRLERI